MIEHLNEVKTTKMTDAEDMIYCTVKIKVFCADDFLWTGTGFLYRVHLESGLVQPLLVTNKHVLENATKIIINFHTALLESPYTPSGNFAEVTYELNNGVYNHPNENIDLCAIPVGCIEKPLEDLTKASGHYPYLLYITKDNIPNSSDWANFSAIESLKMIGYPNGLSDEVHNLPLVRQGITATQMSFPFNGKPVFVVDMACFPGSSGSPIFVHNEGVYFDPLSNSIQPGSRKFLVGVLYQGPMIDNHGTIKLGTTKDISVATTMHLGHAIRADQLLDFDHYYRNEYPKQFSKT